MISFWDRLWLAGKVLTGHVESFRADANSFRVIFDFTAKERSQLGNRLRARERRQARRRARTSPRA